jgi:protein disulfide-isomerase A4
VLKEWGIPLIKVDGTTELELADQYGITGQPPMFKVFRQGRVYDYKGQQEKQNIVDYMRLQTKSPSEEKVHRMGIKNNMNHNEVVIVGFFAGKKSAMYNEYIVAANEMRGKFTFMHTFNEEAGKSFDMPMESVTVFMPELFWTKHENKTHVLAKKSATYKEIIAFIKTKSMPLVGWRHKRNEFKYSERPLIVIYYDVNYDQGSKDTQYIRNKIVNVAENFLGSNLKFAISNDAEYEAEIKTLGFQESGADVNVACYTKNQKFRMKISDEFESKDLAEFIEEFRTGKVKPYMKSLPVPETQDDPVLDIVADNYDTLVHKVKKDAVMFFHAPWCGHCREFDPIYEKIAKKRLDNNENIVFGKLDATSNDVPYMFKGIQGYPSIFFVRASDKFDPIPYKGDRSAESVRDWINEYKTSTGQAVDDDKEIESFTAENFEADVATGTGKKDEL